MGVTVNHTWTQQQKKNLQELLNQHGFTDSNGDALAVDGMIGPKTQQAIDKMNAYQQQHSTPDKTTKEWQSQLRSMNYTKPDGTLLDVTGVHDPYTDAAMIKFDNGFVEGLTGQSPNRTVQTKKFPVMAKMNDAEILRLLGITDPMATQKDANGN